MTSNGRAGEELLTKADLREFDAATKTSLRNFERRLTRRVGWMIAAWVVILAILELVSG